MADTVGTTIDRLGVEFVSKVSADFGKNVEAAVKQFDEKIKPSLAQLQNRWKALSITVATFYKMLESAPAISLTKMLDTSGVEEKMVGTFKDVRKKSVAEFQEMGSQVSKELRKLEAEFVKYSKIIDTLRRGEDPVVDWGTPKYSARTKKMYFPDRQFAVGLEEFEGQGGKASRQDYDIGFSSAIQQYEQKRLATYQRMSELIGHMGAYERARLATQELIAKATAEEVQAKAKIAEFQQIVKTLGEHGLLTNTDEKYLAGAKKHLEDIWRTTKDINVLNQASDDVMKSLVKDHEAVKNIILDSVSGHEKLVQSAKAIEAAYAKIKASPVGAAGGGIGGPSGGGDWDNLIGKINIAGAAVSQFQQKLQAIQLKAYLNPDEFNRLSEVAKAINAEISDLTNKIAHLGSQGVAGGMAEPFDKLRKDISDTAKAIQEAEALKAKGLPVDDIVNLDKAVYGLTERLKQLAAQGEAVQLKAVRQGLSQTNAEIQKLTGGVEINLKSIKQLGIGTLELEKLQGLLAQKMKLIRQEFQMTGQATAKMNQDMAKAAEALTAVQYQVGSFSRRTGDALRAMERWGSGFKDMMKSQMAWLVGGALIFGTVFKIQQALVGTVKTMFEFRQAMIDVGAITEASAADMLVLEKAARDVATSTKMGFMEAAEALKILGQAGLTARESAEALRTVAMLVTATGASSQEAVKVLTTAMNVWNLSAKEAARVGNVLAAALNYSKLEIGDLATSFNYVAAIASQVGMTLEETASSIAVLSNAGLRASTIGTGLRGILGQLIAPTQKFKDEISAVGLKMSDIRMPGNNLIDILRKLKDAGFDMGNIFEGLEKRQAGALASMLNMGAEAFKQMTERITGTNAMMIMFDRSMEGPVNRLKVLANRLLDTGMTITEKALPAFNLLLEILLKLVDSIKDLAPYIALAAVLMNLTTVAKYLTIALHALGAAWAFLAANPFLLGLSVLITGWAALKAIIGDTKKELQETLKVQDRELQDLGKKIMDYEKVNALLKDGKATREEIRDAIEEVATTHKDLNEAIRQGQVEEKELGRIIEEVLAKTKKQFDDLKMTRFTTLASSLEEEQKRFDKLQKDMQVRYGEWQKNNKGNFEQFLKATGMGKAFEEQRKAVEGADEALRAMSRGMKGYTEDAIREALANAGLTRSIQDVAVGYRNLYDIITDVERKPRDKATSEELKSLRDWRKKAASELSALLMERQEAIDSLGDMSLLEGDALVKALEKRALIEQYYNTKRKEIEDKYNKDRLERAEKYAGYLAQFRQEDLKNRMQRARDEFDELIRIDEMTQIRRLEILEEYQAKRGKIEAEKDFTKTQKEDLLAELGRSLADKLAEAEDNGERDKEKVRQKRRADRLANERRFQSDLLKIQTETVNAEIALAKTEQDRLAAQDNIIDMQLTGAEAKWRDNRAKIAGDMLKQLGQAGADAKAIIAETNTLILAEDQRYVADRARIYHQGLQDISEIRKSAEADRIREIEKQVRVDLETQTRASKDMLLIKEQQYDALSEVDKKSEFGWKLKKQMDELTISLNQNTVEVLNNKIALLEMEGTSVEVQAAIAKLREQVDAANERIRKANKELRTDMEQLSGVLPGVTQGWNDFWKNMETGFEFGKQIGKEFGETVKNSMLAPLKDFLSTGKIKTWKEYLADAMRSIGSIWMKLIERMIMDWLKFEKTTSGGSSSGGLAGIFGWALKGLGSIFGGGIPKIPLTPGSPGVGPPIMAHTGGEIRAHRMHSGGLGRDEMLAILQHQEYVIRSSSARAIGKRNLDYMNQTGKVPGGGTAKVDVDIHLDDGLIAKVRPTSDEIALTVATDYRRGGATRKAIRPNG